MSDLENSLAAGATEAYEAMFPPQDQKEYDQLLGQVIFELEGALCKRGEIPPIILHTREYITDCSLDDADKIEHALIVSLNDPLEGGRLLAALANKHLRSYAEGHLSPLKEYFHIGNEEEA